MSFSIKDSDLRAMSEEEQDEVCQKLIDATRGPADPEGIKELERQIEMFEYVFQMDSAMMRTRLRDGSLQETWEICRWLMHLHRLNLAKGIVEEPWRSEFTDLCCLEKLRARSGT